MSAPTVAVLELWLVRYRRSWRGSVLTSFVLPVLFLLAMGLSVGKYVDARSRLLGVSYVDFIAPGVLASTALQVAVSESTWPVFDAFAWTRTYHAIRASPVRIADIVRGHLTFVLFRAGLGAVGFMVVMALFGTVHSAWFPLTLPVAVLLAAAVAAPCFAFSASVGQDGMFAVLFRFAVVPMTLFAGVFFPVSSMPAAARVLAYVSPLWHAVELTRAASLGTSTAWGVPAHLGVLVGWAVLGYLLALRRFTRKLAS
jgi:lipooligosaccharide transport system permease protein